MNHPVAIHFKNVDLEYELFFDKTNSIKEFVINRLLGRKHVSKKMDKLLAVNQMNLSINEGERVGIIGLNGAGKSTILKLVSKILRPTRGVIEVHGHIKPLIEVGAGFNPEYSGRDNIYLNGAMLGFTRQEIRERLEAIIDFAELREFIDLPVKYYSSGMAIRLAFTIATQITPEILLIDEMLSAGDIAFISKAKERLKQIMDKAKIIVMVSHDLALIQDMCTRVLVLDKGKIILDTDPKSAIAFYREKNTPHRSL